MSKKQMSAMEQAKRNQLAQDAWDELTERGYTADEIAEMVSIYQSGSGNTIVYAPTDNRSYINAPVTLTTATTIQGIDPDALIEFWLDDRIVEVPAWYNNREKVTLGQIIRESAHLIALGLALLLAIGVSFFVLIAIATGGW